MNYQKLELHLAPKPLSASHRRRIKACGGSYSEARGYSRQRFVTVPASDRPGTKPTCCWSRQPSGAGKLKRRPMKLAKKIPKNFGTKKNGDRTNNKPAGLES